MSAKRDTQWQALWDAWLNLGETNKDKAILRIKEIFDELKQAACVELKRSAARFARLGNSDEAIYNSLVSLMDVYRRIITLSGEIESDCPTVNVLLAGICEVLNSRLKEFEDMEAISGVLCDENDCNPVAVEKCTIVNRAAAELDAYIATMDARLIEKLQSEDAWATLCYGSQTIGDVIIESCMPEMYAHFQEGLRLCLAELDDLHLRKVAGLYTSFMEREWEELGNIIKVQIQALESASSQTEDLENALELPAVYRILNVLREAYQYIGPVIDELQQLLNSQTARHPGLTFEEFNDLLTIDREFAPTQCEIYDDQFFNLLANEVNFMLDQIQTPHPKTICQMQYQIGTNKILAEKIIDVFKKITVPLTEFADTPEIAVLTGIAETIEIKIESLTESIQSFGEEGFDIVRNFSEKRETPTEQELQTSHEMARTEWLASPPVEPNDLSQFFALLLETAFKTFQTRMQKHVSNLAEKVENFTFRFKKEVLLYEICTYEEILIHSVPRLRDSENPEIAAIVGLLDSAYVKLEILLGENNIEVIRPVPHDAFNAFEHDVLVAEALDGFKKGEIIKMLNTGYKQQDKVILRANVIAAR